MLTVGVHRIQNPAGFGRIIRHFSKSGRMPDLKANPAGFAGFQIWMFFSFNTYFMAATKCVDRLYSWEERIKIQNFSCRYGLGQGGIETRMYSMFVLCLYGAMVVAETEVEIHQETEEDGNTPGKKYILVPDRITPAATGRDDRYPAELRYTTVLF